MKWAILVLIVVLLGVPGPSVAQHGIEIITEAAEPDPEQGQGLRNINQVHHWVFGGDRTRGVNQLEAQLKARAQVFTTVCELSPEQSQKLLLAGSGDLHHFLRECKKIEQKFAANQDANAIWQDARPLRNRFNGGLFGEDSLFNKVLHGLLTAEQRTALVNRERASRKFQLEAHIRKVVLQFDEVIALDAEQRENLTKLIVQHTPVPGHTLTPEQHQQLSMYILYFASKIPVEELGTCLDENAVQTFRKTVERMKGLEQRLETQGLLEK